MCFLGNLVWHIISELGGNFSNCSKQIGKVLEMIKCASHDLKVAQPITNITITMIKTEASAPPRLKVKAAEARHLLPVMHFVIHQYVECRNPHGQMIRNCTDNLMTCYACLDNWTDVTPDLLAKHARMFLLGYCELTMDALTRECGPIHFRLYPEFHLWLHLCESGVNPKLTWNSMDESEIGFCAQIAEGLHARTLATSLMNKYRLITFKK